MTLKDLETRLDAISDKQLLTYLEKLLPVHPLAISEKTSQRIYGGTFGIIYRFQGQVTSNDGLLPWSLILKIVWHSNTEPIDRSQPNNQRYWKREPLAYQSGFLEQLGGPLIAPRCFDIHQPTDNEFWLWLEDVREPEPVSWSCERYSLVARHIGQFSGIGLQNPARLAQPWLGRNLQRSQGREMQAIFAEELSPLQTHPLLQRFMPDDILPRVLALWEDRAHFYTALESLPQTVCHRDACHVNLFTRQGIDDTTQTIAIDWEDASQGAVGEDLVSLVVIAFMHNHIALNQRAEFDTLVFGQYLQGLQDSGWSGNATLARLGYTTAFIRYGLGLVHFIVEFTTGEQKKRANRPIEETADLWADLYRFILKQTDEARQLM